MNYREYIASQSLRPYVDCYWHYTTGASAQEEVPVQRCLPIGTVEIIIQVDHKPCRILNATGNWDDSPEMYFTGLYVDTALWQARPDALMFGIRLKPEAVIELFKLPAVQLFNNVVNAEDVLGQTARHMRGEMTGVFDVKQLVAIAEKHLLNRLQHLKQEHSLVTEACRMIRNTGGGISIETVSDNLYVSKRKLQRDFKEYFGASPKTYQRIVRFRRAYEYARQLEADTIKWADVSYEAGYADQAHFTREFREFTGLAPSILSSQADTFFQTLEACKMSKHH